MDRNKSLSLVELLYSKFNQIREKSVDNPREAVFLDGLLAITGPLIDLLRDEYFNSSAVGRELKVEIDTSLNRISALLDTLLTHSEMSHNFPRLLFDELGNLGNIVNLLWERAREAEYPRRAEFADKAHRFIQALSLFNRDFDEHATLSVGHIPSVENGEKTKRDLLNAQIRRYRTEVEIEKERAKLAERQVEQLASRVEELTSNVVKLSSAVETYRSTEETIVSLIPAAKAQVDEIRSIRDAAQTLAASAADNVMSANYGQMAIIHAKKETHFRWTASILFGAATLGTIFVALDFGPFGVDWSTVNNSTGEVWWSLIKKLLVAGGIAGIGVYFSRLAHHHRRIEVWSSSLSVQLQTLESYLEGIQDENLKDTIREKFAGLTFGGPPSFNTRASTKAEAQSVLDIATAIANSTRS